jgi:hypothetical protein
MIKKVPLLVFSVIFLFACGYQTGVIQKAEKAYVQFLGSWAPDEVTVKISDGEPFRPNPSTLYEITPGKHAIKAWRYDRIVVDRVVFLESQARFEVQIP